MLGNPKNVFWEALFLTIVIFVFGLLLGIGLEKIRTDKINVKYVESEIFLTDILALNNYVQSNNFSCSQLIESNVKFADRIYEEAKSLSDYETAQKLSDGLKLTHKRYDLLRTFLWMNAERAREICKGDFSVVVYLYEQNIEDLAKKATQNVWSKILSDLKEKKGAEIVLIPIAVDGGLSSIETMVSNYKIKEYPVVIIDGTVITGLSSVEELEKYIK